MSVKITKKFLIEKIRKVLENKLKEETLEEQKSKEELEKEIKDLEKQIEAHENEAMKSNLTPKQVAGQKEQIKRKKDRILRLKKMVARGAPDPKDVERLKNLEGPLKQLAKDVSDDDDNKLKKSLTDPARQPTKESKINTPEQEEDLYESRFSKRNTNLFEKLLKEWAK